MTLYSIMKSPKYCAVCDKIIKEEDLVSIKNNSYHKNCVKCKSCEKPFDLPDDFDKIVYINSNTFLCEEHYKEYTEADELPKEIEEEYKNQTKNDLVEVYFDNNFFSKDEIHL